MDENKKKKKDRTESGLKKIGGALMIVATAIILPFLGGKK